MTKGRKPLDPPAYAVGYGRPPVAHQFRKGQSGNPNGRPRRQNQPTEGFGALHDEFLKMLHQPISYREGGEMKTSKIAFAFMRKLVSDALSGNSQSMKLVVGLLQGHAAAENARQAANLDTYHRYPAAYAAYVSNNEVKGLPLPQLLPDPADLELDPETFEIRFKESAKGTVAPDDRDSSARNALALRLKHLVEAAPESAVSRSSLVVKLSGDPIEAARQYQEIMRET